MMTTGGGYTGYTGYNSAAAISSGHPHPQNQAQQEMRRCSKGKAGEVELATMVWTTSGRGVVVDRRAGP